MAIVCHCVVVRDRDIVAAIEGGATTVEAVRMMCGATNGCGECAPAVVDLLRRHGCSCAEPAAFDPCGAVGSSVTA